MNLKIKIYCIIIMAKFVISNNRPWNITSPTINYLAPHVGKPLNENNVSKQIRRYKVN